MEEKQPVNVLPEFRGLCEEFVAGVRSVLGEKLYAVYIYGAVTFPETKGTGDVDFHAILTAPPADSEREALLELHRHLEREVPPLGTDLDGHYILLVDARQAAPPRHLLFPEIVDESWALHRAHMLAGRVAVLHGPDPRTILAPPTREELDEALNGELNYVTQHLADYPGYCVLNLCRLLYSWETGDVVISKAAAAAWASRRFPSWREFVALASDSYAKPATAVDLEVLANGLPKFYSFAQGEIESLRPRRDS
ncbi:MAG: aminoglycoside adenylyltransferase domain-containing protein [Thermotogota bacterium]